MDDERSDKARDVTTPSARPTSASQTSNPASLSGSQSPAPDSAPHPDGVTWFKENSIPIAGVISIALIICLVSRYNWITLARVKDFADMLKNFVEVIAVTVGGWWAIFRFRIGREFQESLIPVVSGRLVVIDTQTYLIVHTQIKNVGQSKIDFLPKASTLKLWKYKKPSPTDLITVPDETIAQFDPLDEGDRYIEPNEIIDGIQFIAIPNTLDLGLRIELQIISSKNNYTWRTACIVEKSPLRGNIEPVESLLKGVQNDC